MNIESRLCSSNKPQFALLEMGVHIQIYKTELSEFESPYYWQRSCAELCEGKKMIAEAALSNQNADTPACCTLARAAHWP